MKCLALAEKCCYSSAGIFLSGQLKYSTVVALSQEVICERGEVRMYIFRTSITTKDGTKIYARDYGKRAFRIWVGPDREPIKRN